jgi:hypothetical protein
MPAEPHVITTGPPRQLADLRANSGFAWSCRQGRAENGELTEIHEITSDDRAEYARHMRGHGFKPPKSPEPWKPWSPPRPATYKPKPMDPGQRAEWVTVTQGHHETPGHLADDGTYVPPSGPWVEETRQARAGVIWSVADTASAWWVQPDEDPEHPVYVKRAGKRDRWRYHEGELYEVPGAAEAARASAFRAEAIRKRGIFPVIDSQSSGYGSISWGTSRLYLTWHSDPACPRASGKQRYNPDSRPPGIVYGYQPEGRAVRPLGQPRWTVLDVADVLVSSEQPPSCLCPDCITGLDVDRPATPEDPPAPAKASPGDATPVTARLAIGLEPPATDAEFLQSCAQLGDVLRSLAGQVSDWADRLAALNLPAAVLGPLLQASDRLTGAAGGTARAAAAFAGEFDDARDVAARGLRFTGQDAT